MNVATPYETLTTGLATMLGDWHKQLARVTPSSVSGRDLQERISRVEDLLALAEVTKEDLPDLHAEQAGTIKHYQGLFLAHFAECEMDPGTEPMRVLVKAMRELGIVDTDLGLPKVAGAGQVANAVYLELKKHRLDTMSQDSGWHCDCRSDSRYAQHDDDGTWTDIDDHRAQMVMKVLRIFGVLG